MLFIPCGKTESRWQMEISKIIPHRVLRNKCGEHTCFEGNSVFLLLPEPFSHKSYYEILM